MKDKASKDEYYHDLDLKTNLWCVFHAEWPRAHSSFMDEDEAKQEADRMNQVEEGRPALPKGVYYADDVPHECDECGLCCGMGCDACSTCRNSK